MTGKGDKDNSSLQKDPRRGIVTSRGRINVVLPGRLVDVRWENGIQPLEDDIRRDEPSPRRRGLRFTIGELSEVHEGDTGPGRLLVPV